MAVSQRGPSKWHFSVELANSSAPSSRLCRFASPDTVPLHIITMMLLNVSGMWDGQSTARPGHRAGLEHDWHARWPRVDAVVASVQCARKTVPAEAAASSGSATFARCSVFAPVASHPARPRPQFSPWSSHPEKIQRQLVPATRQISV